MGGKYKMYMRFWKLNIQIVELENISLSVEYLLES